MEPGLVGFDEGWSGFGGGCSGFDTVNDGMVD